MKYKSILYVLVIYLSNFNGCSNEVDKRITEYTKIIEVIDRFTVDNKKTPSDEEFYVLIKHLGYQPSEGCPCYNKASDSEYELYFGLELGTSMVYNSKSKKWDKQG